MTEQKTSQTPDTDAETGAVRDNKTEPAKGRIDDADLDKVSGGVRGNYLVNNHHGKGWKG